MGGWSESTQGWHRVRRSGRADVSCAAGRWTLPDFAAMAVGFAIHWELGLAVIGLKLWQQASGQTGTVFGFAREKWDGLVGATRSVLSGAAMPSFHVGPRSSGNHAFDSWRQSELARIEAEREKLRAAEREFAAYREELLHAKDREDFDRFMQARTRG
jgi:hypothetical protein